MQNFTTNAINLKSYNLSESDKIIVMYSKEKGLIKGVAKGSKKTSSKLGGRMDMLVANKIMLFKGKNLDTICQAEALDTFMNLRRDMDKLFYSMYCAEIVSNFGIEDDPNSEEIYTLFYSLLKTMSKASTKEELLLSIIRFQLKIMHICGYSIEMDKCVKCGCSTEKESLFFSLEQGGIICENCKTTAIGAIKIHYKINNFLKTLLNLDFEIKTKYDELATERICEFCFKLLKNYISFYSPKKFKTTEILETIK